MQIKHLTCKFINHLTIVIKSSKSYNICEFHCFYNTPLPEFAIAIRVHESAKQETLMLLTIRSIRVSLALLQFLFISVQHKRDRGIDRRNAESLRDQIVAIPATENNFSDIPHRHYVGGGVTDNLLLLHRQH